MRLGRHRRRGFVAHVHLDEPARAIDVPDGHEVLILVVHQYGAIVGQVTLPARRRLECDEVWSAIAASLGSSVIRGEVRQALRKALAPAAATTERPTVSVVVCTRDRADQLRDCIESLLALRSPAHEIVIVDNSPSDERTRDLCAQYPVIYVLEPQPGQTRARNRGIVASTGDLVAYTDDDCIVDPGWLDSMGEAFADPLTMAATGYIGPYELAHPAQLVFELHMGFERHPEPRVFDPREITPVAAASIAGAGANMVFRRSVFERIGMFAEDLGPGTPARSSDDKYAFYRVVAAGYRIRYDPRSIVWHRHRADVAALRRIMEDYGVAEFAYSTRLLLEHRELGALRIWKWWMRHYLGDLRRAARRAPSSVPIGVTAAEVGGALRGPAALRRSRRSRAGIPPVAFAAAELPAAAPPAPRVEVVRAEPPTLTVAIASRNRRERLGGVLDALGRQTYSPERFEVIVVLDGTEDDSAAMVRERATPYALRVVDQRHRGLAATRNQGAREATTPLVVFLDDDIEPVPDFLAEHARQHAEAQEDHLVMGAYPPARLGSGLWEMTVRAWWTDHFHRKAQPGHRWSFTDFIDGNASIPTSLFSQLGGFDERFSGGRRQDWELGVRMLAAGVPFAFLPAARGDHLFDTQLATGVRNARQEGRYDVLIAQQHPHAKWRLPLGRLRLMPGQTRLPARLAAPLADGVLTPAALRAADSLESLRMRRGWFRLVNGLLLRAYVAGLLDALGSREELLRFLTWDESQRGVALRLGVDDGLLDSPTPDGLLPEELLLEIGDLPVIRVPVLGTDGQWDAENLIERAVGSATAPLSVAAARAGLSRSSATRGIDLSLDDREIPGRR